MSTQLTNAAIAEFDAQVKHAYQAEGFELRDAVRVKTGIVGSTIRFPKMGKGVATPRIPQTDVVPMNVAHTNATATMEDWNAAEYTDIFDQQEVNFDEQRELATTISGAIGRRNDQLIIDALEAASTTLTVAVSVGGANSNWNMAKVRRAKALLDANNVPKSDRHLLMHANGLEALLGVTEVTSADFNSVKALVDGSVDSFVGFKWHVIGDRDEGGLAEASGDIRTNFAWHKAAVGLGIGIDFRTEVNYIPEKTSWLANGIFKAGAVAIDPLGIVEIETDET